MNHEKSPEETRRDALKLISAGMAAVGGLGESAARKIPEGSPALQQTVRAASVAVVLSALGVGIYGVEQYNNHLRKNNVPRKTDL